MAQSDDNERRAKFHLEEPSASPAHAVHANKELQVQTPAPSHSEPLAGSSNPVHQPTSLSPSQPPEHQRSAHAPDPESTAILSSARGNPTLPLNPALATGTERARVSTEPAMSATHPDRFVVSQTASPTSAPKPSPPISTLAPSSIPGEPSDDFQGKEGGHGAPSTTEQVNPLPVPNEPPNPASAREIIDLASPAVISARVEAGASNQPTETAVSSTNTALAAAALETDPAPIFQHQPQPQPRRTSPHAHTRRLSRQATPGSAARGNHDPADLFDSGRAAAAQPLLSALPTLSMPTVVPQPAYPALGAPPFVPFVPFDAGYAQPDPGATKPGRFAPAHPGGPPYHAPHIGYYVYSPSEAISPHVQHGSPHPYPAAASLNHLPHAPGVHYPPDIMYHSQQLAIDPMPGGHLEFTFGYRLVHAAGDQRAGTFVPAPPTLLTMQPSLLPDASNPFVHGQPAFMPTLPQHGHLTAQGAFPGALQEGLHAVAQPTASGPQYSTVHHPAAPHITPMPYSPFPLLVPVPHVPPQSLSPQPVPMHTVHMPLPTAFAQPYPLQPPFHPMHQAQHAPIMLHAGVPMWASALNPSIPQLSSDQGTRPHVVGSLPPRSSRVQRGLSAPPPPSGHLFAQPAPLLHHPNVSVGPGSAQYRRSESWHPSPASSTRSSRGDEGALLASRTSALAAQGSGDSSPATAPLTSLTLNEPLRSRLEAFDASNVGRVHVAVTGTPQQDCVRLLFVSDSGQSEELTIRKLAHTVVFNATMETTPVGAWATNIEAATARIVESTQLIERLAVGSLRPHDWYGVGAFVYDAESGTGALRQLLQFGPASEAATKSVRPWADCQHAVAAHLACLRRWALGADPVGPGEARMTAAAQAEAHSREGSADPSVLVSSLAAEDSVVASGDPASSAEGPCIAATPSVFAEPRAAQPEALPPFTLGPAAYQLPTSHPFASMPPSPGPHSRERAVSASRAADDLRALTISSPIPLLPDPPSPPPRRRAPHPFPCECGRPPHRHEHQCVCFRSLTASMAVLRRIEPAIRRSLVESVVRRPPTEPAPRRPAVEPKSRVSVFHLLAASGLDSVESTEHTLQDVRHWLDNPNIQGYHLFISPLTPPGHPGYQALYSLKEASPPHVSRRITFLGPDSSALKHMEHAFEALRFSLLLEYKIYGPATTTGAASTAAAAAAAAAQDASHATGGVRQLSGPPLSAATRSSTSGESVVASGPPAGSVSSSAAPAAGGADTQRPRYTHSVLAELNRDHCQGALRELMKHASLLPVVLPAVVDLIAQHFFPPASA